MYKNIEHWQTIRHRVLEEGISKRQVAREAGIHWDTLARILSHPIPPSYKRKAHRSPPRPISRKPDQLWNYVLDALANAHAGQAREILLCLSGLDAGRASKKKLRALTATLKDGPVPTKKCIRLLNPASTAHVFPAMPEAAKENL